ncbi:MAG: helix-turn-helix transcriptional regulator [Lachnospiraceae bacterium]|nr:helix-turn-helix transcriptional regulator [Lachnospiraceae bacterium]
MKNALIAKALKKYRTTNNLSVKEVTELLEQRGVKTSDKSVYAWECGRTQPDADTLLMLCSIYNVDNVLESFGYNSSKNSDIILTDFEYDIIRKYRESKDMQKAINKLLDLD